VNLSPDIRVFGYCLFLSLATGIVFGLAPALQATRLDLNRVLKQEGRTAGWRSRGWLRSALLTAQVAVCLLLLVTAGLITRGLIAAQARDPGFRMHDVVTASFDLNRQGYDEARAAHFYQVLTERLRSQPGVRAVALAEVVPLSGSRHGNAGHLEGRDGWVQLIYNRVSPEYFDLLDIPIVRGRGFGPSETSRDAVMIVSESTARRFWPGTDPIGKKIRFGEDKVYKEVIGIAKDVYATNLFEVDGVFVYMPVQPGGLLSILVEAQDPAAVTRQIRAIAAVEDRNLLVNATPLKQRLRLWETPSRILTVLASSLGLFALLLAATGIFGVVNYGVSQRTHEIGTRMALGANGPDILRLVISQSLRPVLVGAVFGLAGAAAASRILSKLLFGISPLDPASFLGMSLVLIAVTCVASYGPAYRAVRIDPAAALRHE
jgi:predicted permease